MVFHEMPGQVLQRHLADELGHLLDRAQQAALAEIGLGGAAAGAADREAVADRIGGRRGDARDLHVLGGAELAAQHGLAASERRIDAARAGHLPTLNLGLDSQRRSGFGVPAADALMRTLKSATS